MSIRDEYLVETDNTDWPKGMTENDKKELVDVVLEVLRKKGPLPLYLLYENVRRVLSREDYKRVQVFKNAEVLHWAYGAVARACYEAHCEQCWHAPE